MIKALPYLTLSCLLILLPGCSGSRQYNNVVKELYVHKYGVPVVKSDWENQGKDGKVVQLRKDGVTAALSFSKGILHGETTFTFPNTSTIHLIETYDQGELVARRENYTSGVPMREEVYEQQTLIALTQWYEDGTPSVTETYQNELLQNGEYRTQLNVVESSVRNGEGIRICRNIESELISKDTIQNGEMVEQVTYYTNGDPAMITPYEKGLIHGMRLTFLPGGLPKTVEQWVEGAQEGITIAYQNGEKVAEIPYLQGAKNGIEYRYRDETHLVEEISWKNNVQHGPRKIYVDGETKIEWFHQGELVSHAAYERLNAPKHPI
ncbi:MAG: toxin-antitoxin system YwqK family antitoxin [Chlamydiales bacterium]